MSIAINHVVIAGHLTRDVSTRETTQGSKIASFALAINRRWRDQQGTLHEEVDFLDIEAWGRLAEIASQLFHKGSPCLVTGRLRQHRWSDAQGQSRSRVLVVADQLQTLAPRSGTDPSHDEPDDAVDDAPRAPTRPAAAASTRPPRPPRPVEVHSLE